jgi:hypothetical protein
MFEKYLSIILEDYREKIGIAVHESFILCCYASIEKEFYRITSIRLTGRVQFAFVGKDVFFVESDDISRMPICLFINHNWITFIICWQSLSGKIYKPEDEIIDCNDVRFWFENLDINLVNQCINPGGVLPFKTDKLGYALEITGLDMNMHIRLKVIPGKEQEINAAMESIDNYIDSFNLKSERKGRKDGVVHNWKRRNEGNDLIYELDMGSAGMKFLADLLKHFSKIGIFETVVIGGD